MCLFYNDFNFCFNFVDFYRLRNSHLIAFGRSLGGAVAISLADAYPDIIQGVIIENTFLSVGKYNTNTYDLMIDLSGLI